MRVVVSHFLSAINEDNDEFFLQQVKPEKDAMYLLFQALAGNILEMLVVNLMLMMSSAVLLHLSMAFTKHWQYIIVGAGPAGLQMGYYLQHSGRDYVILERSDISGKCVIH